MPLASLCLAAVIYFEARGEPIEGQLGVAHLVINRVNHPNFPDDVCAVVSQRGQFPWFGKRSLKPVHSRPDLIKLAESVINGETQDPTNGKLYFATPVCRAKASVKIGRHLFC